MASAYLDALTERTRAFVNEGYESTMRLGLQYLFKDKYYQLGDVILTDPRFTALSYDIEIYGGTVHSGSSFAVLCHHLSMLFTLDPSVSFPAPIILT
jgi:hypothetical protein